MEAYVGFGFGLCRKCLEPSLRIPRRVANETNQRKAAIRAYPK